MATGALSAMSELVPQRAQMSMYFIINSEEENDVMEIVEEDVLAAEAAGARMEDLDTDNDPSEDDMSYSDRLSYEERLRSVVVVRHMLESIDCIDPM